MDCLAIQLNPTVLLLLSRRCNNLRQAAKIQRKAEGVAQDACGTVETHLEITGIRIYLSENRTVLN